MVVAVRTTHDVNVRRFGAFTGLLVALALGLGGVSLPQASAIGGAFLDPALRTALAASAPGDELEAAAVLPSIPTALQLSLLRSTGASIGAFKHLPMVAVKGTPAELAALSSLPLVQSLWLNVELEEALNESTVQIQADRAWVEPRPFPESTGFTGRGVGVAVIDSGIDGLHAGLHFPEITVQNVRPVGFKDVGFDSSQWTPAVEGLAVTDVTSGHGTHVAGIIGGRGIANGSYRGVAPGSHLIGLGASDGAEMLTILQSYDWIIDHKDQYGIRVINNSWANSDPQVPYLDGSALDKASKAAVDAGIVVVFAAGNAGKAGDVFNNYARNDWVISVGSVNKNGVPSSFSSRGNAIHHPTVVAPGEFIASARATAGPVSQANATPFDLTNPASPRILPVEQWPYYTVKTGTSMATPHVAGVVALMLEANPLLTPAQVKQILAATAIPVSGCAVEDCGRGLVNALAAVRGARAAANQPPVAALSASVSVGAAPLAVTLDASASADPDGSVAAYRWDWEGDGQVDSTTSSPLAARTFAAGVHRPRVSVVDDKGLASSSVSVEVRASNPPTASATAPKNAKSGQAVTFDASASTDADGTVVAYEWNFGDGSPLVTTTTATISRAYTSSHPTVMGWSVRVVDDSGVSDAVGGSIKITP